MIPISAPPNKGSSRARVFAPYITWLLPVVRQLTDFPESDVQRIPHHGGVEIGIIAGSHDRTVSLENTHIEGETDHIVVESSHWRIMKKKDVLHQVGHFLNHGKFQRDLAPLD